MSHANHGNGAAFRRIEIVLRVYRLTLTSVGQSEDFVSALGAAIERMEAQLKRYTSKLRERFTIQRRASPTSVWRARKRLKIRMHSYESPDD